MKRAALIVLVCNVTHGLLAPQASNPVRVSSAKTRAAGVTAPLTSSEECPSTTQIANHGSPLPLRSSVRPPSPNYHRSSRVICAASMPSKLYRETAETPVASCESKCIEMRPCLGTVQHTASKSAPVQDPALQVVSKKISLGAYKPHDLVAFEGKMVAKRIVNDLKKLLRAAKADGLSLKVVSGYRSYERQIQVYNAWVEKELKKNKKLTRKDAEALADRYSARAGHSEHQLGTTVDILSSENGYQFSSDNKLKYVGWLERNAHKYNFKISYPVDSVEYVYEPWHVRWYPSS